MEDETPEGEITVDIFVTPLVLMVVAETQAMGVPFLGTSWF